MPKCPSTAKALKDDDETEETQSRGVIKELVLGTAAPFGHYHGCELQGVGHRDEVCMEVPPDGVKGEGLKMVDWDMGWEDRVVLPQCRSLVIEVDDPRLITKATVDQRNKREANFIY